MSTIFRTHRFGFSVGVTSGFGFQQTQKIYYSIVLDDDVPIHVPANVPNLQDGIITQTHLFS